MRLFVTQLFCSPSPPQKMSTSADSNNNFPPADEKICTYHEGECPFPLNYSCKLCGARFCGVSLIEATDSDQTKIEIHEFCPFHLKCETCGAHTDDDLTSCYWCKSLTCLTCNPNKDKCRSCERNGKIQTTLALGINLKNEADVYMCIDTKNFDKSVF